MQDNKYGFIYIWYDKKHKRYYIGSHWGTTDDGYICSSHWMRKSYRRRPNDFKRRIIKYVYDRSILLDEEDHYLGMIKKEEIGKKYYNLVNCVLGHWSHNENSRLIVSNKLKQRKPSDETKRKISESKKGQKVSDETKQKISRSIMGHGMSEETKEKISNSHKGKKLSEEHKNKIAKSNCGKKLSEEHKKNISKNQMGRNFSAETKEKISKSLTGKTLSEKTKKKISESKKNKIWINNGIVSKVISNSNNIPEGWNKGRIKWTKKYTKNSMIA